MPSAPPIKKKGLNISALAKLKLPMKMESTIKKPPIGKEYLVSP